MAGSVKTYHAGTAPSANLAGTTGPAPPAPLPARPWRSRATPDLRRALLVAGAQQLEDLAGGLGDVGARRVDGGDAGLAQFTDEKAKDARILALARKISYVIDPDNEYPRNYSGHIKVTLKNGAVVELRQPHMRGGAHEPLTRADLEEKFTLNARHGGWGPGEIAAGLALARNFSDGPIDLQTLRR